MSYGGKKYRFPEGTSSLRSDIRNDEVESDIDRLAQEILTLGGQRKKSFNEQDRQGEGNLSGVDEMRSRSSSRGRKFSGSEYDNLARIPRNASFNLGEQDLDGFSEGQTVVRWVDKRPLSNR